MPTSKSKANKLTILIAEEDVIVRFALAEHLRGCGQTVVEAADAKEARAIFLAGPKIDILLADAQLAGPISGFALAQWVRKSRPGVAVILTGPLSSKAQACHDLCERVGKHKTLRDASGLADRIHSMQAERDRRSRKPPSEAAVRVPRRRQRAAAD